MMLVTKSTDTKIDLAGYMDVGDRCWWRMLDPPMGKQANKFQAYWHNFGVTSELIFNPYSTLGQSTFRFKNL